MAWITRDDFVELGAKIKQRGWSYILSKVNPSAVKRVRSTFGASSVNHANWWLIPNIRKRWNQKITADPNLRYEDYVIQKYLAGRENLRMLSLGCGIGSHERHFAAHGPFSSVIGLDLAKNLIDEANKLAREQNLTNCRFEVANVNTLRPEDYSCDVLLFHSSLHHFTNLPKLLADKVPDLLTSDGLLVVNDYWGPNRLQWTQDQKEWINSWLEKMPENIRLRYRSDAVKKKVSGPGLLRMLLSDPSEAAESELIKPLLRKHYVTIEEKEVGGNLLMPLLKDIAHHFVEPGDEAHFWLDKLFAAEDEMLKEMESILFFGVYKPLSLFSPNK